MRPCDQDSPTACTSSIHGLTAVTRSSLLSGRRPDAGPRCRLFHRLPRHRLQARGATVVGLELDERAAAEARRFCEAVHVGDVETMELPLEPGSFDAIVCGDFIEHLRDPRAFLARVRPVLAHDGSLVLSTPNIANWAMRLSLLFGRFRYTEWGILDRTHTHLFTRKTLEECLEAAGYRVTVFDYTVPVPVLSTPRVEAIAHAIGRLRPSLFAYQFVVAAVVDRVARRAGRLRPMRLRPVRPLVGRRASSPGRRARRSEPCRRTRGRQAASRGDAPVACRGRDPLDLDRPGSHRAPTRVVDARLDRAVARRRE